MEMGGGLRDAHPHRPGRDPGKPLPPAGNPGRRGKDPRHRQKRHGRAGADQRLPGDQAHRGLYRRGGEPVPLGIGRRALLSRRQNPHQLRHRHPRHRHPGRGGSGRALRFFGLPARLDHPAGERDRPRPRHLQRDGRMRAGRHRHPGIGRVDRLPCVESGRVYVPAVFLLYAGGRNALHLVECPATMSRC